MVRRNPETKVQLVNTSPFYLKSLHVRVFILFVFIRKSRNEILSRRRERQQKRQELSKRKSAAAQERMRILSMLAKSGGSGAGKKKEDTFGMRDEDWDIYKAVSKVRGYTVLS